ncbi:MAG: zf-HC2 domain-containing protein [Candidatus Omnitrophica bacterium]|nr:zf-HC2 domain-containing protein [Candidatus Omnitrophota bacterium]
MECEHLRKDFPLYLRHQLPDSRVHELEEHLCVCEECRIFLSNLLDNKELLNDFAVPAPPGEPAAPEKPATNASGIFSSILIVLALAMILFLGFLVFQSQKFTVR